MRMRFVREAGITLVRIPWRRQTSPKTALVLRGRPTLAFLWRNLTVHEKLIIFTWRQADELGPSAKLMELLFEVQYCAIGDVFMRRFRPNLITARIAAMSFLALSSLSGTALAQDVLYPTEPPLADSGWTARYSELLVACYQGTMDACDRVASDRGMVFDTPIYNYAATCGGRLDLVTARRLSARMLENGVRGGTCSYFLRPQ